MTDSDTPICDLIVSLLSTGLSTDLALQAARLVEQRTTIASGSTASKREQERLKKARWRERRRGQSTGTAEGGYISSISTKTQNVVEKKESKKPARPSVHVDKVDTPDDGWPADHLEIFWKDFPPFRREAKRKVGEKLARLRRDKVVTWDVLITAVRKFAATDPGQFAPAPMVWLNGEKWDREYGGTNARNSMGQPGARRGTDAILAAAHRRAGALGGLDGGAPGPAGPVSPAEGRPDHAPGSGGGPSGAFDFRGSAGPYRSR